jgi:hypothetical protein
MLGHLVVSHASLDEHEAYTQPRRGWMRRLLTALFARKR